MGPEVEDDVDVAPWSPRALEAAVGRLNRRKRGGRAITRTEKATSEECEKQGWLKQEGTHVPVTWMDADSGIKKREDVHGVPLQVHYPL